MRGSESLDIAEVFKRVSPAGFSVERLRVYQAITRCRTAALGGHLVRCNDCGHREQSYNSCWNRHCPKCRGGAAFRWTAARVQELLPVEYFHVVFTLPEALRELCRYNKRIVYDILLTSASNTLLCVAEKNHGVKLGFFGVLHSWTQELLYHPHAHFVVPGGGINAAGRWQKLRKNGKFLLPVRILSKVFRGKCIEALKRAYRSDKLSLKGKLSSLKNPQEFERLLNCAARRDWVVYAKRPFAGPEVVLKYLSNYTHRVAISNRRLRAVTGTGVTFSARDRKRKGKKRLITLPHATFVRRFLQHTLPFRFRRIRYYGFLYNGGKASCLARIRAELNATQLTSTALSLPKPQCTQCGSNRLIRLHLSIKPHSSLRNQAFTPRRHTINTCLSPPTPA